MSSRKAESGKGAKTLTQSGSHADQAPNPEVQGTPAGDEFQQTESAILAHLRAHPDFFGRHPDALGALRIAHGPGGAVSLIEHQVKVLRRQLDTERSRLSHLITRAREYESVATRLHSLALQLIPIQSMQGLCDVLQDALRREFSAAAVTLRLIPDGAPADDPVVSAFQGFLDRAHALCGPLEADKVAVLFGELDVELRSAALVPIHAEGRSGVLAIGATDPERFRADMGTDLLDRLGEIVSHKLRALPPDLPAKPRRKAAVKAAAKVVTQPATDTVPAPTRGRSRKAAASPVLVSESTPPKPSAD